MEGFTALQLAVRGGHLSCVKLLVTCGHADVNEGDGQTGRTALHHAVLTDNLAIVGYLLLEVTLPHVKFEWCQDSEKTCLLTLSISVFGPSDLPNFKMGIFVEHRNSSVWILFLSLPAACRR